MVSKTHAKRRRDIKTKLMAAVAMLLVSSIMMVSTTYAWFTLSTAPEVTGITTAVGANGNLEMALLPANGNPESITTSTADGTLPIKERNVTWGNLVDLGSTGTDGKNIYGLDRISFKPSALNVITSEDGKTSISDFPLQIPVYGADGRISSLAGNKTLTGVYDGSKFVPDLPAEGSASEIENAKGVRVIGTSSSMSEGELQFREATSFAKNYASDAKSIASGALVTNGSGLAGIAVKHATANDGSDTYTQADIGYLKAIANALVGDGENKGALDKIHDAYIEYAVAAYLKNVSTVDSSIVEAIRNAKITVAMSDGTTSATSNIATIAEEKGVTLPTGFDTNMSKLLTAYADVSATKNDLDNLTDDAVEWSALSPCLTRLVNPNQMTLNGIPIVDVKDRISDLINNQGNGFVLSIPTGSGVISDVADFCGNYSAFIVIPEIVYGSMSITNVKASMTTETSADPLHLTAVNSAIGSYAGAGGDATKSITDYYGYIIDLAFRTNASGSKLMLQPDAIDRVYKDNNANDETMGHGASMTFVGSSDFTATKVSSLMACLRFVFFDPSDGSIIGYARLDEEDADVVGNEVTMKLYMVNPDGTEKVDDNGERDYSIMELQQNTATALSVLVYLDGNEVTNADVATSDENSMTGTLNLQFSSSATLVPMEYADVRNGSSETGNTPATPSYTVISSGVTVNGGDATVVYVTTDEGNFLVVVPTTTVESVTYSETTVSTTTKYGNYTGYAFSVNSQPETITITLNTATAG